MSILTEMVAHHLSLYLHIPKDESQIQIKRIIKYENFSFFDPHSKFPYKNEQLIIFENVLQKVKFSLPTTINKEKGHSKITPVLRRYENVREYID